MTIVIAIDGLAGSGKGTIAKNISSFYNFQHLDSGILYRSVAYLCHKGGDNVLMHLFELLEERKLIPFVTSEDVVGKIYDLDIKEKF